jgi:hypothetical protein
MEGLSSGLFGPLNLTRSSTISSLSEIKQACCGGMLFGMDSGIIGGVLTMDPFKQSV